MDDKLILVTDWEKVDKDDFYLSDDWMKKEDLDLDVEQIKSLRDLQKKDKLFVGYIVGALPYCIYYQMDASQVFIDEDMEVLLHCESSIIGNDHEKRIEYTN